VIYIPPGEYFYIYKGTRMTLDRIIQGDARQLANIPAEVVEDRHSQIALGDLAASALAGDSEQGVALGERRSLEEKTASRGESPLASASVENILCNKIITSPPFFNTSLKKVMR